MTKIGIIGRGHVGKAMHRLFPDASIYDKYHREYNDKDAVKGADLAFVCVPTPALPDGRANTSIVQGVVSWLDADVICIKSTIPPGTTDYLRELTGKRIVFSPEYQGETPWQASTQEWPYVIAGGYGPDADAALSAFQPVLGPNVAYWKTDAVTAELVKLTENYWLALQVTWANEMARIADAVGTDWNSVRELWALDPRVSRWHTLAFNNPAGYGGKCLPKDTEALNAVAKQHGYSATLLQAMIRTNAEFRGET